VPQSFQNTDYVIEVITSDISGAGTDASVQCVLVGDGGGRMSACLHGGEEVVRFLASFD